MANESFGVGCETGAALLSPSGDAAPAFSHPQTHGNGLPVASRPVESLSGHAVVIAPSLPAISLRRPGRPRGLGKVPGSGRKKGGGNAVTRDLREYILKRGRPLELLCAVSNGERIRIGPKVGDPVYEYASLHDRIGAAAILARKVMPDIKEQEVARALTASPAEEREQALRAITAAGEAVAETIRRHWQGKTATTP